MNASAATPAIRCPLAAIGIAGGDAELAGVEVGLVGEVGALDLVAAGQRAEAGSRALLVEGEERGLFETGREGCAVNSDSWRLISVAEPLGPVVAIQVVLVDHESVRVIPKTWLILQSRDSHLSQGARRIHPNQLDVLTKFTNDHVMQNEHILHVALPPVA